MLRSPLVTFALGLVLGTVALGAVRFAAAEGSPDEVHYHANWAVVLDGERVDFTADRYMEDVAACSADGHRVPPRNRVHLHNNDMDVVHVHHEGVTWGHFLANLEWGLGMDWLVTDTGEFYRSGEDGQLTFVINGLVVHRIDDRIVEPHDRLLIHWGDADPEEVVEEYFPMVASNAARYDEMEDPGGCGAGGDGARSLTERLQQAFLF